MKIRNSLLLIFLLNFVFCYQNLFSQKIYLLAHPTNFIIGEINQGENVFSGKVITELYAKGNSFNVVHINAYECNDREIWPEPNKEKMEKLETVSLEFQDGTSQRYLIDEAHSTIQKLKDDIVNLANWSNLQVIFPQKSRFYGFEDYKRPAYQIFQDTNELQDDAQLKNGMKLKFGIKNEMWEIKLVFLDDKDTNIKTIQARIMNLDTINWLRYQIAIMLGIEYVSETYKGIKICPDIKTEFDDDNSSKSFHELGYDKKNRTVYVKGLTKDNLNPLENSEKIFLDWGTVASLTHGLITKGKIECQDPATTNLITNFATPIIKEIQKISQEKILIDGIIRDGITAYLLGKFLYLTFKPNNMETVQESDISKELTIISEKINAHIPDFLKLAGIYSIKEPDLKTYLEKNYGPKIAERIKLILDLAIEFAEHFNIKKEDPKNKISQRIFEGSFEFDKIPEKLALVFINYYYNDTNSTSIDVQNILNAFHFSWIPDIYKGSNYATIRSAINKKDILVLGGSSPLQSNLIQLHEKLTELKTKTEQLKTKLETLKTHLK